MKKKGNFVYIDAENLKASVVACGYKEMDFPKLLNWLRTQRGAERIYLYAGYSDQAEKTFYQQLEKQGYIVKLKKVMQYPAQTRVYPGICPHCKKRGKMTVTVNGRRKANCDSELTLDVINDGVRKKYAEITIFSADGDFCKMYEYVAESMRKKVTVYAPMGTTTNRRTSTAVKKLGVKGILTLNALEGILQHYAKK